MFGKKKKELKKRVHKILVMHQNGISSFINDDVINLIIDEPNNCIVFSSTKNNTARLDFDKITGLELGERGNTKASSSTGGALVGGILGGTTGAIIGSTIGKQAACIPTLKIKYQSSDCEKEINLYQCRNHAEGSINSIHTLLSYNIEKFHDVKSHIDL